MTEFQEMSACMVQASSFDSPAKIYLTPWDLELLMIDSIQKGLLFYKSRTREPEKDLIHHLKSSLSRTLDFFPPLAGRLGIEKREDETECFFIDCNNAGALFTNAIVHGLTVNDILRPKYVPDIVQAFFPLNGIPNCEGTSNPLLAVQVTELDDGYFIGCTINHCVADGTSFWHFMNSWSEISRGFDRPSRLPSLKRGLAPDRLNRPVPIPSLNKATFQEFRLPLVEERVVHFSKENIAKLKSKANYELGNEKLKTPSISSLQALLAHIWRSTVRCGRIEDVNNNVVNLKLMVGARGRLRPPLPEGYFGNAVHFAAATSTPDKLLSRGLGWTAQQLNKVVAQQTHEEIKKIYENWLKSPHVLDRGLLVKNSLMISSSPRFDMYGNDFGWGKPVAVRSGIGNKTGGKITIFEGPEEGSIDVEICLSPYTLHAMERDEEFMANLTVK